MNKGRFPNWMITCWTEAPKFDETKMCFLVYQKEIAPTTNTPHYQGYVEFKEKITLAGVKKCLGDKTAHCEVRKGTQEQAINYCTKVETRELDTVPQRFGTPKTPGARNDLDAMVDAIENGYTSVEMLHTFRGNALRHIGMINTAIQAYWMKNKMDQEIMDARKTRDQMPILNELSNRDLVPFMRVVCSCNLEACGNSVGGVAPDSPPPASGPPREGA